MSGSQKLSVCSIFCMLIISLGSFSQSFSYTDSLKNALSQSTNTEDSLRCLVRLTWSHNETDRELTVQYGLSSLKLLTRAKDSSLISDAYDAGAFAQKVLGNTDSAKQLFQRSLEIGLKQLNPVRIGWAYYNLEVLAVDEENFELAKVYAHAAYNHFHQVENNYQAENSYWLLINNNQVEYIDTLIQVIKTNLSNVENETDKVFQYLTLTNLYNKKGNRKEAMLFVQQAMELADRNKEIKGMIKAYNQIAFYFIEVQKNYSMALEYYKKAFEIVPEDNPILRAELYINIGEMHHQLGDDSLALDYYNRALVISKQQNHRHTKASAYMKLGEINYEHENYADAKYFYTKCYETNCDVCPRIKFHQALMSIGHVHLLENEFKKAGKYYNMGQALADSSADPRAKVISLQSFARLYEKQNNIPKTIQYLKEAQQVSESNNYLKGELESAKLLSQLYTKTGDYKLAFRYLKEANRLADSIDQANEIENLAKLETYFDFKQLQDQKEFERAKAKEELDKQKLFGRIYISGALVIALFGFLLYWGYRRKQRDNKILHEQKLSIEKMSKKVHEADHLKLQFFTNISHEFKTPLTLILGITEKLSETVKESQAVDLIRKNSLKLLQLVNHLLDLRKIDNLQMKLSVREDDLVKFTKGLAGSFETLAREKNIELKVSPSNEILLAFFDQEKIEKILSNLISNALKFTPQNGKVIIQISGPVEGRCSIEVMDNGIGIAQKEMNNIFKRFYRVNNNGGMGSGIGLAMVKELAEVHRGNIHVTKNDIGGTSFFLDIPVQKHAYTEEEITVEKYEPEANEYPDYNEIEDTRLKYTEVREPESDKKIILIVEDNGDLRNYLCELFIKQFAVLEADNGKQGYEMAHKYIPDIIISDIMMPQLSGLQLTDKLKNNETTSHIPIILLTAKNDLGTRISSFEKGADEYISKPFDSVILLSRVDNLLRMRKQLSEKFSNQYKLQPREITIENSDKVFLDKTILLIEKHISDPNLNVDFLCLELGISRTQLYRKLNALTEYPPKQFIRIIRLKRAAQILEQGQNNIAEVMDATGFSNYSFFNNCFKEFFGEYPKDYALINVKGNLN